MSGSTANNYPPYFSRFVVLTKWSTIDDPDFSRSGLKATSLIRVGRLAVIDGGILLGTIGEVDAERLKRIKVRLSKWFKKD